MGPKILITILSTLVVAAMSSDSELKIIQSNGQFSTKLYNTLSDQSGNVFFSPLSAHTVLALSYLGSSGATEQDYVKSLALPDKKTTAEGYKAVSANLVSGNKNIALYLANKIYVGKNIKLKEQFSKAAKEDFNAEVQNIDFGASEEAAKTINSWVEQKTVNKITDLFSKDDLDSDTQAVLVNAIYFKGAWKKKFQAASTRTEPFYLNENDKIDVQMMHQRGENYGFKNDESLNAKVLELPFDDGKYSMVVILPNERDGIKDLEAKLKTVDLTKVTEGLHTAEVSLALPKFKIETKMDLGDSLNKLGLGSIFTDNANFSDLLEGNVPIKVSKVIQKAFLEVNEEGAEAAAATGLGYQPMSMPIIHYFLADHPFIVVYRHKSVILFVGRVSHPVSGDSNIAPTGEPVKDPSAHIINIKL